MAGGPLNPQYAPIYIAAGKAFGIPANVLAGVADVETDGGQNIARSSAGAIGLMQFEPGTAQSLGVNPMNPRSAIFGAAKYLTQLGYHQNPLRALGAYNGGPGNPQYGYARMVMQSARRLAPALQRFQGGGGGGMPAGATAVPGAQVPRIGAVRVPFQTHSTEISPASIAGNFLSQESKLNPWEVPHTPGLGATENPLLSTGVLPTQLQTVTHTQNHMITLKAHNALQGLAGQAQLKVAPGTTPGFRGYVNPIRGATLGRTDMGVDFNMPVGTPIRAIGDSRVVHIYPNWYAGQPYVLLQLLNGPKKGKYYYVAEQIAPHVKPGQVLHAGDTIGTYASQGTGIEMGWGSPGWQTLAQATGRDNAGVGDHANTPAGLNFRNFLGSLGA